MRVLLVSDLHYVLPQFDWVVEHAADYDLVVVAGDSLDVSSPVPLDVQAAVIVEYATMIAERTTVIVSSGNHDLTGPDVNGEQCALWMADVRAAGIATDGDAVSLGDVGVTVCPWWDGDIGRAAVEAQLALAAGSRPATWMWVYHWPPTESPTTWTGRSFYGDADLRAWIEQHRPDVVLCGHVHQSPFKPEGNWVDRVGSTWVFNAGHQIGRAPCFVEIDLTERTATWVSILGVEHQALDGDLVPRTSF